MKTANDLVTSAKLQIHEVGIDDAELAIRNADVVIDVRDADEFMSGHIPGAVHMSRGMLEFKLSANPTLAARDLKIVMYCKTGGRAALAALALKDMAYLSVTSLAGGIDAWLAASKPIAKPVVPSFD